MHYNLYIYHITEQNLKLNVRIPHRFLENSYCPVEVDTPWRTCIFSFLFSLLFGSSLPECHSSLSWKSRKVSLVVSNLLCRHSAELKKFVLNSDFWITILVFPCIHALIWLGSFTLLSMGANTHCSLHNVLEQCPTSVFSFQHSNFISALAPLFLLISLPGRAHHF